MSGRAAALRLTAVAVVAALVGVLATLGVQRLTDEPADEVPEQLAGMVADGYAPALFGEDVDGLPDDRVELFTTVLSGTPWTDAQARAVAAALVQAGAPDLRAADGEDVAVVETVVAAVAASGEVHPGLRAAVLEVLARWMPAVHQALVGVEQPGDLPQWSRSDVEATIVAAAADAGAAMTFVETYAGWAGDALRRTLTGVADALERRETVEAHRDLATGPGHAVLLVSEEGCGGDDERCRWLDRTALDAATFPLLQAVADTTPVSELPADLLDERGTVIRLDGPGQSAAQRAAYSDFVRYDTAVAVIQNEVGAPELPPAATG